MTDMFVNDGKCEERWSEHEKNSCPLCSGSGHKDDAKIKPLVWKPKGENYFEAECPIFGVFAVELNEGWFGYQGDDNLVAYAGREIIGEETTHAEEIGFDTERAAMGAANGWRTQRILSVLK